MTRTTNAVLGALALALAAGCGSTVNDEDDTTGSGATGSGASGSGASGAGGSSSASSGSGAGGACSGFADEEGLAEVTVRFRNDSPMPVYLPAGCSNVSYTIRPTAGDDGTTYVYDGSCMQTCEDLQTSPQVYCGACPSFTYLVPVGGSLDVTWSGVGTRSTDMPAECFYEDNPQPSCSRILAAPANQYRAEVTGFGSCEGECTCDETGQCFGTATGLTAWADPVDFTHPGSSLVEVVFGVCAFGCAGGG